jgi:hypothetical protein
MLESAREVGTTFLAAGAFSQTSPPCPAKLLVTPVEAVARFPPKTRHPLPELAEDLASD